MDYARAVGFAFGLAIGMRKIHSTLGIPHGDLKADNVLFAQGGQLIKISDFGVTASITGSQDRAVRKDIEDFGKVLWYLFTGREQEPDEILGEASSHQWIDSPIRDLITDSCRPADARGNDNGNVFFDWASRRINDYGFSVSGQRYLTPEEYHDKQMAEMASSISGALGSAGIQVESAMAAMTGHPSEHINRGASLLDLGKREEAFECFLAALKISSEGDEHSKAIWYNVQLFLSGEEDINSRGVYFQKALAAWRG